MRQNISKKKRQGSNYWKVKTAKNEEERFTKQAT